MSTPGPFATPFAAPWEAQVFALVVALQERGLFTAQDWARALGQAIRPEGEAEGTADYRHWLSALEALLHERGLTPAGLVDARAEAFLRAAAATPHGQPIRLENDPEGSRGP